jgi:hypothetical protein
MSLRAPDGSIARLATHIDIAGVAAKRRWTLIREAALLNWRVSTTGGAALRGGLDDLRYRALAEIRKQPGCSNVQGIAINRVSDQHAEVYHLRARLMPTRPPVRRYMSKAFAPRL